MNSNPEEQPLSRSLLASHHKHLVLTVHPARRDELARSKRLGFLINFRTAPTPGPWAVPGAQ